MKQIKLTILLIATSVLLCACPDKEEVHRYTTFVNKSDREIVSQRVFSGAITSTDTLFFCGMGAIGIMVNSQHNFECPIRDNGWENSFNAIPFLQISVMDAEIYDKYISEPCDTIRQNVPILHIYRLTLADLQRMNWTVVFPPEE